MVKFFPRWTLTLLFSLCATNMVKAASFDCGKANTEIEAAICNTPALSRLDEEIAAIYSSIDKKSRYFEIIKKSQKHWINYDREANEQNFQKRVDFLLFAEKLSTCSTLENFLSCTKHIEPIFQECLARGNYTTLVMNRCGHAYIQVLEIVELFESTMRREYLGDDSQSTLGFNDAHLKWKEYIRADCGWQYDEYREGTIRGQIWSLCMMRHYERRIADLNNDNSSLAER